MQFAPYRLPAGKAHKDLTKENCGCAPAGGSPRNFPAFAMNALLRLLRPKPAGNLARWIMANQTNQVTIGRADFDACSICTVLEKLMEPLHHESTQAFRWRRSDGRLDVHKYFALGDGLFLAHAACAASNAASHC